MRVARFGSVVLTVCLAVAAQAQEQRSALEGTVRDVSGGVVPGTRVQATSASGVDVATSTDATGHYRFPSIASGEYEIAVNHPGFAPSRVAEIELLLGQNLRVDLTLSAAPLAETIAVVADPPTIDVTQSGRVSTILRDDFTRLPRGRDFISLVPQVTGANIEGRLGGLSIDGAGTPENQYVMDGTDSTGIVLGLPPAMITDFVDQVQVKSGGYSAEHGGATGGVVSVATRSGSDRWSGDAGVYYTSEWLQVQPRGGLNLSPTDLTQLVRVRTREDEFDRWEPGFSIGGPIKVGRAWFFLGYQPSLTATHRTVTFDANGDTRRWTVHSRTHNAIGNVTAQFGPGTRLRVSLSGSPGITDGFLPSAASNPRQNFGVVTRTRALTVSSTFDHLVAGNLLLSARVGQRFQDRNNEGVFQGPRYFFQRPNVGLEGVPPELQQGGGYSSVLSNSEVTRDWLARTTVQVDATWFLGSRGQHALKAGAVLQRIENDLLAGQTGPVVGIFWGEAFADRRGQFGYYTVDGNAVHPDRGSIFQGDVRVDNIALFVQDAWTIRNRVTLNLGLRVENEHVPSYAADPAIPRTAIKFGLADKIAPRAGMAWDVRGDGRWKAFASWGAFYDTMKFHLSQSLFGAGKSLRYWYTLETPDWPSLIRPGCPPACPGTLIEGPLDFAVPANAPGAYYADADLEPFRVQEAVAGVEHALTPSLSVDIRYVHKHIDRAVEDIGSLDAAGNEVYFVGNPGFGRASQTGFGPPLPKAVRDYDALEVNLDRRTKDGWGLRVGYLWSRLFGNYSGLSQSDEFRIAPNFGRDFDHPIMAFDAEGRPVFGLLATDRTHQLKAHAIYELPFAISIGTTARLMSGVPVTRFVRVIPGHNYPVFYAGRHSDGRTPPLSQVDLYVQHEAKLRRGARLQLSANVINLFDQDTAVARFSNELIDTVRTDEEAYFGGVDIQELIAAQRLRRDPRFLLDSGFQPPRETRLAVKVLF